MGQVLARGRIMWVETERLTYDVVEAGRLLGLGRNAS